MMYKRLIDKLRTESLYKDKATLEIMDLCMEAADVIQYLLEGADEVNGALQEKIAENERMNAELERLKNCRHECNIVCLLDKYNEKCAELERVTRERDAAIEHWRGFCAKCSWRGKQYLTDGKMDARCDTCRKNGKCNWEWRGPQEAEKDGEE